MVKYRYLLILFLLNVIPLSSQETKREFSVDFRRNSIEIDTLYNDNSQVIKELKEYISTLSRDTTIIISDLSLSAFASPEGTETINSRMVRGRLNAIENLVLNNIDIPDSIITRNKQHLSWRDLELMIQESNLYRKGDVLTIIDEILDLESKNTPYNRSVLKLKGLENGNIWEEINHRFFNKMRSASVIFSTKEKEIVNQESVQKDSTIVAIVEKELAIEDAPVVPVVPVKIEEEMIIDTNISLMTSKPEIVPMTEDEIGDWHQGLYLKTNVLGLGLAMVNTAVEIDLMQHLSLTLPIYYSAWNYFKQTIKFRTFAVQPELRYWLSEENDGFFSGVHFGLAYYNFAFDGDYRYQDHNRETPAIGGGVSIGYRLPISKNNRWRVEFSLGSGVYSRHYDKFHNTPRTKDGLMIESIKKTYWNIDQAAVSFSYSFDLKKKVSKR